MSLTRRSPRAVGLAAASVLLLHLAQVAIFGHDLVGVLDGHGVEFLPGVLLSPSPALLLAAFTVAVGLALLVVQLARLLGAAPRTSLAGPGRLTRPRSATLTAAQMFAASRHGRAPPGLLT